MEKKKKKHCSKKVISAGALVLDIIPVFGQPKISKERMTAGGTVYLKRIDTAIGGSVGNTGLALNSLGVDTTVLSKVGGDPLGTLVEAELERSGCSHYIIGVSDMNTSASVIVARPGEDRMILHSRGASQKYEPEDIPEMLLLENDLFHFGYPTGMECMYSDGGKILCALYKRAKSFGITTSMDLSFPGIDTPSGLADWHKILRKTLPYVDIFLPSFEEIFLILEREKYLSLKRQYPEMRIEDIFDLKLVQELARQLIGMGAGIVVIKCGEKGSYVRTGSWENFEDFGRAAKLDKERWEDRELFAPPYEVRNIVSTNGAGDTFVAGFLSGILLERSPEETLQLAAAAAAVRIESPLGREGIPAYEIIDKKIAKELFWKETDEPDSKWYRDMESGVYIKKKE